MRIGIEGGRWTIDGEVTYPGAPAEGLLMNVRMVNAVFEDAGRPSLIDPEANTARFLGRIPEYVAWGVRAFTLCLQGGYPGYEGAVNTAFREDGSLEPRYMARVQRVIAACDRAGAGVILGLYYQRQDQYLRDEAAVEAGVVRAVEWLRALGAENVLLEIANEYNIRGFDHACLREPEGIARLIRLAKVTAPGLLVSASGRGDGRVDDAVGEAADYILFHLNGTPHAEIPERIQELRRFRKPLVCNEDRKLDAEGARAAQICVEGGASWGLMAREVNQYFPPFRFGGAGDDLTVYRRIRALTTPPEDETMLEGYEVGRVVHLAGGSGRKEDAQGYFPAPDAEGGWRALTGEREIARVAGMDKGRLDEAFRYLQTCLQNGGLLVARRGWLVYERYLGLGSREATPNMASCGKSFTSVAMGILMGQMPEAFPEGLDQRVWMPEYLPEIAFPPTDPAKVDIRLGQLLAFSAGIRGNNPSYVHGRPVTLEPKGADGWQAMVDDVAAGRRDMVDGGGNLVSTRTLWCPPGGGYSYASSSIHLVSMILRHLAGCELEEYVRRHLAAPLGWGPFGWGYRQHPAVTHTPGAGGIALRATDVLRFCYLLLRGGRWGNQQVVPEEYVRHCSGPSPYQPHYPYSLQFNVNGTGDWLEAPRDSFWKSGSGGYCLYVVPSLDLVVYKMGGRNGQYSPADTGMPLPPPSGEVGTPETPELAEYRYLAPRKVLEMVVQAVRD